MCIGVVVNRKYERYIPYFIFFVLKAYPNYTVKIFVTDTLSADIKKIISKLEGLGNVVIEENFFKGLPISNQELKTYRWLIPQSYFKDYEYVYIGDADMMICKETPGILEQHINHMEKNNLPYSNCVRPNTKRLTGLHFFKVKEYYNVMGKTIEKYTQKLKKRKLGLQNGKVRNEEILYRMIKESGLSLPQKEYRIDINGSGPHHGLHLGIWRGYKNNVKPAVKKQILKDNYNNHYQYYQIVEKDNIFKEIKKIYPLGELKYMEKFFK